MTLLLQQAKRRRSYVEALDDETELHVVPSRVVARCARYFTCSLLVDLLASLLAGLFAGCLPEPASVSHTVWYQKIAHLY